MVPFVEPRQRFVDCAGPMRKRLRRRGRCGQAFAESALALFCFVVMLAGLIDGGALLLEQNFVSWAAGEGARYAMVHGATEESVSRYVKGLAVAIPRPDALTVTATWPERNERGRIVRVSVRCLYRPITSLLLPDRVSVTGVSEMPVRE